MDTQLPLILRPYINPPGYSEYPSTLSGHEHPIKPPAEDFYVQTSSLAFSTSPKSLPSQTRPRRPHSPQSPKPTSTMPSPALLLPLLTAAAAADPCTTFPSWTISDFHSNTTDSVGAGGSASFTLVNNLTNATDALSCPLQVNYRCIFAGVPSDANLTVNVAVRAESLTLLLDESVLCPGRET